MDSLLVFFYLLIKVDVADLMSQTLDPELYLVDHGYHDVVLDVVFGCIWRYMVDMKLFEDANFLLLWWELLLHVCLLIWVGSYFLSLSTSKLDSLVQQIDDVFILSRNKEPPPFPYPIRVHLVLHVCCGWGTRMLFFSNSWIFLDWHY